MKVAIVCGAPSSEMLAPFGDPSWEIWVLGNRINRYEGKRVTRIFEIHDDLSEHGDVNAYVSLLVSKFIPMVVGHKFTVQAPHIRKFDFEQSDELFGSIYLTSSTAYMISQAISEGATEIGLYGSDMSVDDNEYFWQRPCLEAWVGFAKGRGIKVTIPEVSPVGRSDYVEGRNSGGKPKFKKPPFTQTEFRAVADMHRQKIDEKEAQIRALTDSIGVHSGAMQVYERLEKVARACEAGQDIKSLTDTVVIR